MASRGAAACFQLVVRLNPESRESNARLSPAVCLLTVPYTMSREEESDVELGHVSTSYLSATLSDDEVQKLSYGKRLAQQYLNPEAPPLDSSDKIFTFRRLRRYDVARIEHDLLRLYHHLKTSSEGGTDADRVKLTSLLHDHGNSSLDMACSKADSVASSCHPRLGLHGSKPRTLHDRQSHRPRHAEELPRGPMGRHQEHANCALQARRRGRAECPPPSPDLAAASSWTWTAEERKTRKMAYKHHSEGKKGYKPRHLSLGVRIIASTLVALAAGAWIIVPMVLMSLAGDQSKGFQIIATSAAVVLFGFASAAAVQMSSKEIFLATATYAAVLVVFVGASGPATSGG